MSQPLDPEASRLVQKALEVLKQRNVQHGDICPRCDTFDWDVEPIALNVERLAGIPAHTEYSTFKNHVMAIQIVCKNCGYTMFHNLKTLGLSD
jgi:predicted nucleic-acid-binding Zn-ribbon protein